MIFKIIRTIEFLMLRQESFLDLLRQECNNYISRINLVNDW